MFNSFQVFELSLAIFPTLLQNFKQHLKMQIEVRSSHTFNQNTLTRCVTQQVRFAGVLQGNLSVHSGGEQQQLQAQVDGHPGAGPHLRRSRTFSVPLNPRPNSHPCSDMCPPINHGIPLL